MNKKLFTLLVLPFVVACAEKVEVPPAYLGKILTKSGYQDGLITPSKFRLDWCMAYCDRLVLLEASDRPVTEQFDLFMPRDQLNMAFDIRATMSIDTAQADAIYARVPSNGVISFGDVYSTYGQPIVRDVVRQVMAEYTINEVASSRERVSADLTAAVTKAMQGTPLKVMRFGIADVKFPEIITKAKENAAERRELIVAEEAQFEIQKVRMARELEQAQQQRAIERERAAGEREVNEILAASVTPEYVQYKNLEVMLKMTENSNAVFFPMEALGTIGLQQKVFAR